jgi:hypothetical protein
MLYKLLSVMTLVVLSNGTLHAKTNKKDGKEILTLSGGKYVEIFDQDSVEQIGNVLYNVNSEKIIGFIKEEPTEASAGLKPEIISRWLSIDPLARKYPNMSPYVYGADNPISFKDPDGADIVYFNTAGHETSRTVSKTQFQTFVGSAGNWQQAPMPKVIKGYEVAKYQQYDYNIAASTFVFNQNKNTGTLDFHTEGGLTPSANVQKGISDLDPTMVKAVIMQETKMGTIAGSGGQNGTVDIMQSNVTGDWGNGWKSQFGLQKGGSVDDPGESINAGIGELYIKGFKGGSSAIKNAKGTITGYNVDWTGGSDWSNAAQNYNGGGAAKYGQDYDIQSKVDNAQTPQTSNYVTPDVKK